MALFFTLTSAVMIKAGIKVRTMRFWIPSHASRIKVGSIHKAKLNRQGGENMLYLVNQRCPDIEMEYITDTDVLLIALCSECHVSLHNR